MASSQQGEEMGKKEAKGGRFVAVLAKIITNKHTSIEPRPLDGSCRVPLTHFHFPVAFFSHEMSLH